MFIAWTSFGNAAVCRYNQDNIHVSMHKYPLNSHFYMVKLGCEGVNLVFLFSPKHSVTNGRAKPQKPRRWKSMLIHQGWFTALYT